MFVTPVLFLACAPETVDVDPTEAALAADVETLIVRVDDYDPLADGEMIVELVQYVANTPPAYGYTEAAASIRPDGDADLALPVDIEPLDDESIEARYRMVLRPVVDGHAGPIWGIHPQSLVWRPVADPQGAPAGWSMERRSERSTTWTRLPERVSMPLNLLGSTELTLGGPAHFDTDVELGVVLVSAGRVVPGVVGMADAGRWGVHLADVPEMLGLEGASARVVAYAEVDGELGWNPAVERVVGEACDGPRPVEILALPDTDAVATAARMAAHRLAPGLNAVSRTGVRARGIADVDTIVLSIACE